MVTITFDIATELFHVVDEADQYRGDRWGAVHFLRNVGFNVPTAVRMLDKAEVEAHDAKRQALWARAQTLLTGE